MIAAARAEGRLPGLAVEAALGGRGRHSLSWTAQKAGRAGAVPAGGAARGRPAQPGPRRARVHRRRPRVRPRRADPARRRAPAARARRGRPRDEPGDLAVGRGDPRAARRRAPAAGRHRGGARACATPTAAPRARAAAARRGSATSCAGTCATASRTRSSRRPSGARARCRPRATSASGSPTSWATRRLGERLATEDVGRIASRLAELAAATVVPPARLVKTIGDAAMFVSAEVPALVRTVRDLREALDAEGADMPPVRVGLAYGSATSRGGDWFGSTVNLASRITVAARPAQILATGEVVDARARAHVEAPAPAHSQGRGGPRPALLAGARPRKLPRRAGRSHPGPGRRRDRRVERDRRGGRPAAGRRAGDGARPRRPPRGAPAGAGRRAAGTHHVRRRRPDRRRRSRPRARPRARPPRPAHAVGQQRGRVLARHLRRGRLRQRRAARWTSTSTPSSG